MRFFRRLFERAVPGMARESTLPIHEEMTDSYLDIDLNMQDLTQENSQRGENTVMIDNGSNVLVPPKNKTVLVSSSKRKKSYLTIGLAFSSLVLLLVSSMALDVDKKS